MRVPSINHTDPRPNVGIYSFGVKGSNPERPQAQFEFDLTAFRNPMGQRWLRKTATGVDPDVRDWVGQDPRMAAIIDQCRIIANDLIKPHTRVTDGDRTGISAVSTWLSFSFKDIHGRLVSPAAAELVAEALAAQGFHVATVHYDL